MKRTLIVATVVVASSWDEQAWPKTHPILRQRVKAPFGGAALARSTPISSCFALWLRARRSAKRERIWVPQRGGERPLASSLIPPLGSAAGEQAEAD